MPRANTIPSSSTSVRRKKGRRTIPKKLKHHLKTTNGDAPSPEEWASMKSYGSFVVHDAVGGEHKFGMDDDALVLPAGCDPNLAPSIPDHQLWVARLIDIRQRSNTDVWVRVKWYWSGKDVGAIVKSFKERYCATRELLASDSEDYIPSLSFIAVIPVIVLDEGHPTPPNIGPNTFFCRSSFRYYRRSVIKLDNTPLCLCGEPYNPDLAADSPSLLTMHFCPRLSCSRAYHRGCLVHHNFLMLPSHSQEEFALNSRELRLLTSLPPEEEDSCDSSVTSLSSDSQRLTTRSDCLSLLPAELLSLARQPLVRPTFQLRIPHESPLVISNITGNIAAVVRARKTIRDAINGTAKVPDNWKEKIGVEEIETLLVDGDDSCPHVTCPSCGEPI